jgi:hypothetical protein
VQTHQWLLLLPLLLLASLLTLLLLWLAAVGRQWLWAGAACLSCCSAAARPPPCAWVQLPQPLLHARLQNQLHQLLYLQHPHQQEQEEAAAR